ncbi:MAG: MarR family winged helix-turn-helix transcriptional regulator [Actinomycetota bacterium]|nr:MarR family winged helix-turn-helix transcriptional regulator [Actinomycetota bacterium]
MRDPDRLGLDPARPRTSGGEDGDAEARAVDAARALARLSRSLERASGELSLAHYRVLAAIAAGDERASRVARRLALGKPTVSASVDTLGRRGLIRRTEDATDQRAAALELTTDGVAALARAERAMAERLRGLIEATSDPAGVSRALRSLADALDRPAGDEEGS